MTRRMIDSGMWSNENFAALPAMARLLQVGMINHADDQGRIKAHPAYLRSQIFPYDDVAVDDVRKWLQLITQNGTAIIYEVDGKEYIQLVKWWDYQSLQYASPSDYPAPSAWQDRIRYNAKGGMVLTFNWTTTKGETLPDTCDCRGNLLGTLPILSPGNPPETPGDNPPGNPPETPTGNINKDQLTDLKEDQDQLKEKAEGVPPPSAAPPDADISRVWAKWDANMPGAKTRVMVDSVNELLNEYSAAEIEEAITIAVKRGKRTLSYVEGILAKGVFSDAPKPGGGDYPTNVNGRASPADKSQANANELRAMLKAQGKEAILHG